MLAGLATGSRGQAMRQGPPEEFALANHNKLMVAFGQSGGFRPAVRIYCLA